MSAFNLCAKLISMQNKSILYLYHRYSIVCSDSVNGHLTLECRDICRYLFGHFWRMSSVHLDSNFPKSCYPWSSWQHAGIGWGNGLVLTRRQPTIWTNNILLYWRISASFGIAELTWLPIIWWTTWMRIKAQWLTSELEVDIYLKDLLI